MQIHFLESFVSAATNLSFSAAASEMWISQPAVSQQIRAMEKELGFPLFKKNTRTVQLTAEGEVFLQYAQEVVRIYKRGLSECRSLKEHKQRIRLGYNGRYGFRLIPDIIKDYNRVLPEIGVLVNRVPPGKVIQSLTNNEQRFVMTPFDTVAAFSDIQFQPLYKDSFYCIMNRDDPYACKERITIADLLTRNVLFTPEPRNPPTVQRLVQELKSNGVVLESAQDSDEFELNETIDNLFMQLRCTGSLAIFPFFSCPTDSDLCCIPFETDIRMDYVIAYRGKLNEHERRFIHSAQKIAAEKHVR